MESAQTLEPRLWNKWLTTHPPDSVTELVVDLEPIELNSELSGRVDADENLLQSFVTNLNMNTEIEEAFPTRNGHYKKVSFYVSCGRTKATTG